MSQSLQGAAEDAIGPDESAPVYLMTRRVAANVRAEAARFGDTQTAMAKYLGITPQSVSARYRGLTPFTLQDLCLLAQRYGLTPGQLVDASAPGKATKWAPWDSNPQPADYKMAGSGQLLHFPGHRDRPAPAHDGTTDDVVVMRRRATDWTWAASA